MLDDEDFHERQDMLSLGQHRAIATALNSLVFHTHCPAAQAAQNGSRAPAQAPLPAMEGTNTLNANMNTHAVPLKDRCLSASVLHAYNAAPDWPRAGPRALQGQSVAENAEDARNLVSIYVTEVHCI